MATELNRDQIESYIEMDDMNPPEQQHALEQACKLLLPVLDGLMQSNADTKCCGICLHYWDEKEEHATDCPVLGCVEAGLGKR